MGRARSKSSGYLRCHTPTIACINKATVPLGVDFDALIKALQKYVDEHVAPVWGTPAKLIKADGFVRGCWAMVFLNHADHPHSLGYHDLTPEGYPQSKVFVTTTKHNKRVLSVVASHELVEMLVDPSINHVTMKPRSKLVYGYEAADPVEDLSFRVNGIPMTNFVYPTYFETFHKPRSVQFDHLNKVKRPFHLLAGGYQGVLKGGKWVKLVGSPAKRKRLAKEDRRGHRSEKRAATRLKPSSRKHMRPPRKA